MHMRTGGSFFVRRSAVRNTWTMHMNMPQSSTAWWVRRDVRLAPLYSTTSPKLSEILAAWKAAVVEICTDSDERSKNGDFGRNMLHDRLLRNYKTCSISGRTRYARSSPATPRRRRPGRCGPRVRAHARTGGRHARTPGTDTRAVAHTHTRAHARTHGHARAYAVRARGGAAHRTVLFLRREVGPFPRSVQVRGKP